MTNLFYNFIKERSEFTRLYTLFKRAQLYKEINQNTPDSILDEYWFIERTCGLNWEGAAHQDLRKALRCFRQETGILPNYLQDHSRDDFRLRENERLRSIGLHIDRLKK